MISGRLPPRPQELLPRRMELPADFSDEWKKIGSKRSKFEDLGLPIQKPKVIIVKEYSPAKTPEPDYTCHKVRFVY